MGKSPFFIGKLWENQQFFMGKLWENSPFFMGKLWENHQFLWVNYGKITIY